MTTTLTTLADIEEKVGVIIRDLFKSDSTLIALMGRTADSSIHYSFVPDKKTRANQIYPYLRIDLADSDVGDYSHDGSVLRADVVLTVNCWAYDPFIAHKMSGRTRTIVNDNAATLRTNHLCCRNMSFSSYTDPRNEGKDVTHDVVRLFIKAEGAKS